MKKANRQAIAWPIIIKTKRLVLRPLLPTDYPAWVEAHSSRKPAQNEFDLGPEKLTELTRTHFNRMRKSHRKFALQDTGYRWSVFERKTNIALGWVDLWIFCRGNQQSANFGYFINNQYWRRGFGQEASRAMAIAAFRDLKLQRLEASISPKNRESIKLIRALGFKKEALRRKCNWHKGKWTDDLVYSATPADFGLPMKKPKVGLF